MLADKQHDEKLCEVKPIWMEKMRASLTILAALIGSLGFGCASPQGGFSMSSDSPTPYFSFGFTPEWPWKSKAQDRPYRSVRLDDAGVVAGAKQVSTRVKARWPEEFWPERQTWMSPGSGDEATQPATVGPVPAAKSGGKLGKNPRRMPLPRTDQAESIGELERLGGEVSEEKSPANRSVSSEIPRTGRF